MVDKAKLIDNYIYFYHLEKFCVLPLYPETITDTLNSTFQPTNALSRSAPVYTYSNSGPRTVTINLDLHRDLMNDVNTNVSNLKTNVVEFRNEYYNNRDEDYVDILIKYLQSVALPKYQVYNSGSKSVIPPMVAIRFGNDIFIKGVVTSGITVTYKKPILVGNKYAIANVSFTVTETDPYDADTVVQTGSFRGISSTFKGGIYKDNTSSLTGQYRDSTSPGGPGNSATAYKNNDLQNINGSGFGNVYKSNGDSNASTSNKLLDYMKKPNIDFVIGGKGRRY